MSHYVSCFCLQRDPFQFKNDLYSPLLSSALLFILYGFGVLLLLLSTKYRFQPYVHPWVLQDSSLSLTPLIRTIFYFLFLPCSSHVGSCFFATKCPSSVSKFSMRSSKVSAWIFAIWKILSRPIAASVSWYVFPLLPCFFTKILTQLGEYVQTILTQLGERSHEFPLIPCLCLCCLVS